jgi:hypothetical protein
MSLTTADSGTTLVARERGHLRRLPSTLIVAATLLVGTFAPVPALAQTVDQNLPYGAEPNGSFPAGAQVSSAGNMYFSNGELIAVERATSCTISNEQARYLAVRYYDPNSGVAYQDFPSMVVQCVRWWPIEVAP